MKLVFSKTAKKEFIRLDAQTQKKVGTELDKFIAGQPVDIRKMKGQEDYWRIRAGDYRIIVTIDQGKVIVLVLQIGHRREIYRKI